MAGSRYKFGDFVLDTGERELRRGGASVPLTPKMYDILAVLVEEAGHLVEKDTLLKRVWPDSFVEEANLAQHIFTLRKALGEPSQHGTYIETVPKRGYRFVAKVVSEAPARRQPEPSASLDGHGRWIVPAAVLCLLVVVVSIVVVMARRPAPGGTTARRITLMVLPFDNYTGDSNEAFIADGFTEELITQLGRLSPGRLAVIARTSSMSFKGTKESIAAIARAVAADFVLEGSVRRLGGRTRISAQLIDARDETHLWAQSYERESRDILRIESEIAQAIAREVQIELTPEERARAAGIRTIDLAAHDDYLRGRHILRLGTDASTRQSIRLFEQSIVKDPGYAPAYAGLADASIAVTESYVRPDEVIDAGRAAARKALELDDSLAEAHVSSGAIRLLFDWDWPGAEQEFRRALALNPSLADAHGWYAHYLGVMGRVEESIVEAQAAVALDPRSVVAHLNAGWVYYLARRPQEAANAVRRATAIDPQPSLTHTTLWMAYASHPDLIHRIDPHTTDALALAALAGASAIAGDDTRARQILTKLQRIESSDYVCPYEMAAAFATLQDRDEAFRYLEKSYQEQSGCLPDLMADPRFDGVRSDPRFGALLSRLRMSTTTIVGKSR